MSSNVAPISGTVTNSAAHFAISEPAQIVISLIPSPTLPKSVYFATVSAQRGLVMAFPRLSHRPFPSALFFINFPVANAPYIAGALTGKVIAAAANHHATSPFMSIFQAPKKSLLIAFDVLLMTAPTVFVTVLTARQAILTAQISSDTMELVLWIGVSHMRRLYY